MTMYTQLQSDVTSGAAKIPHGLGYTSGMEYMHSRMITLVYFQ